MALSIYTNYVFHRRFSRRLLISKFIIVLLLKSIFVLAITENIFKEVRNILNQDFEILIKDWFQNAYRVNDDIWKTRDFNDTKAKNGDGSLIIHIRDKYAKDFATGDLISIYIHRFCNGDQKRINTKI